jgi:hypothetical protein
MVLADKKHPFQKDTGGEMDLKTQSFRLGFLFKKSQNYIK